MFPQESPAPSVELMMIFGAEAGGLEKTAESAERRTEVARDMKSGVVSPRRGEKGEVPVRA